MVLERIIGIQEVKVVEDQLSGFLMVLKYSLPAVVVVVVLALPITRRRRWKGWSERERSLPSHQQVEKVQTKIRRPTGIWSCE